jgi:indole-3-glycerol phosphate synthase
VSADILARIVARKHEEVAERRRRVAPRELEAQARAAAAPRGFRRALEARVAAGQSAVIAEIKRASPSKGVIRADFDPAALARSYAAGGAACLSVLTDRDFFHGAEAHLQAARAACALPVLRKDFTVDAYQVHEARALGADAVLLIVAALDDAVLRALYELAAGLGLDALVEVHDATELGAALWAGASIVGINNRDLRTFEVRMETCLELIPLLPPHVTAVAESGFAKPADVEALRSSRCDAVLVGEAFMTSPDPAATLAGFAAAARGAR